MRLFIAIPFEKEVRDRLTDLQETLKAGGIRGRFTPSENIHMTLAFIGDYADPDRILDIMETVSFRPFTLQPEGLQHFRDLYLLRVRENPALSSYVRRLRRALSDEEIPFDRKKFRPHITLARKVIMPEQGLRMPAMMPAGDAEVRRISLMRSDRGRHGMIYTDIGGVGDDRPY